MVGKIENPLISVVMSVYNGEKFLEEAIDSILNQSFQDFEFIIINDCSTDRSLELLDEYKAKDHRIILINKPYNKGLKGFVENLNLGLKQTKGKYIARMDQDDIALPDRFLKQIEYLEKNPSIFLVGNSLNIIDESSQKVGEKKAISDFRLIKKRIQIDNPIFHPTIMFRREDNLFYRDKFYACEDFDFHLRLIADGKIIHNLSESLLNYRILSTSMSRKGNSFIKRLFLEKAKEFYKERMTSGGDSYEDFDDKELLNVLNEDAEISKETLIFAGKVAIMYQKREELKQIQIKLKKKYNQNIFCFQLNQIGIFNSICSRVLKKIR